MDSRPYEWTVDERTRTARWRRDDYSRDELERALCEGRVAGDVTSHDRANVLAKIERLTSGDPDVQFGIRGLEGVSSGEVLALMANEAGFDPNPAVTGGPCSIDGRRIVDACIAAGRRLAAAAERGERVVLATGHPVGPILLYIATGELLEQHGAKLLTPLEGVAWEERGKKRRIKYMHGVAVLVQYGSAIHTHEPGPMERMLEEAAPDLVFADHGFAGAAIQAGIDTISIADVNDPAPVVAMSQGRTETVIVMDDNVEPDAYWPCFQGIASQFPR